MIIPKMNERGMMRADFEDLNGKSCSIQESMVAKYPALWLGINEGTHLDGHCLSRMHISHDLAVELVDLLQFFIDYGELPGQPGSIPATEVA